MAETISVNFSGPALAFLLYENVNAACEQEGFLLGDTHVIRTNTITDADSHSVQTRRIINVKAVVSCPKTCLFYNSAGQIDKEKIKDILGTQIDDVVGWFKYEPFSELNMTLRSKIIHKELSRCFGSRPELFLCCLLNSSTSHNHSTHKYTQILKRYHNNQFEIVPLHIENLGDPSDCYKPKSQASKAFLDVYKSLGSKKKDRNSDWKIIGDIQDKLHSEIVDTMAKLSISERARANLEHEVEQLRQQVECHKTLLAEKERATKQTKKTDELLGETCAGVVYEKLYLMVDEENNEIADEDKTKNNKNSNAQPRTEGDVCQRKSSIKKNNKTIEHESNVMEASSTSTSSSSVRSPSPINFSEKSSQLIDLTMSDGEEIPTPMITEQQPSRGMSYAQAMLTPKPKKLSNK